MGEPLDLNEQNGFNIFVKWDGEAERFRLQLEAGPDHAELLTRDQVMEWVELLHTAMATAMHDRAVALQQAKLGARQGDVGQLLRMLREGRDPLKCAFLEMELFPLVAFREGGFLVPVVEMHHRGVGMGQWEPADMLDHTQGILACLPTVDLDTAYLKFLEKRLTLERQTALQVVADLIHYRDPALTFPAPEGRPSAAAEPPSDPGQ